MMKLKNILAEDDTILFIGSGISLWSGLPSWTKLIGDLGNFVETHGGTAELVRAEASRGDLLQAASYGFDQLTKPQIGEFIRSACKYGIAKPHEIHQKIVALGVRCFITTNYDNLIEEALRQWRPDIFWRPAINNRHLTETAEIVHARAKDFVFKPHGDAADSDSIILTREQYRQLLPQGERQNALESLKILLASRPIIYLGFGLRDPDFMYVRDVLANTYKGGTRDHYAVMADITDVERDYWRRNYGIHLIGYDTTEKSDGSRDHSGLIRLLDSLSTHTLSRKEIESSKNSIQITSELKLILARHASRLSRKKTVNPELPIHVHAAPEDRSPYTYNLTRVRFHHAEVSEFLNNGPFRALLVGLPGAGKTYALERATAHYAEKLHTACLEEITGQFDAIIPVLVDMKLYQGKVIDLINQSLPSGLSLETLAGNFNIKIFVDSFNEMPRAHWESGDYESDFVSFMDKFNRASVIIGSRTDDGLSHLSLPTYWLDQIDEDVLSQQLIKYDVNTDGRFGNEILSLLQKPFYFQTVVSGAAELPRDPHPKDLYESLFKRVGSSFVQRFGFQIQLERILAIVAYDAINNGEEAFPLQSLLQALSANAVSSAHHAVEPADIANWLVSASLLIPFRGARIAFVHQTVTEYLAAGELARRYTKNPSVLKEKLALTRWDQAIYLALSMLPNTLSEKFFNDIIRVDFTLALNGVKYLEGEHKELVRKLLTFIIENHKSFDGFDGQVLAAIDTNLPITQSHEPELRTLKNLGDMLGGAAAARLVKIKGEQIKSELILDFIEKRDDYNYCCNGLAPALQPFATAEDVKLLTELIDNVPEPTDPNDSDNHDIHGLTSGVAQFLSKIDVTTIRNYFIPPAPSAISRVRADLICSYLWHQHSTDALGLAAELLLRGVQGAATAIYFIAETGEVDATLSWQSFTLEHAGKLLSAIDSHDSDDWSYKALHLLCQHSEDIAKLVEASAQTKTGIAKAALLQCAKRSNPAEMITALSQLIVLPAEKRALEEMHLLDEIEIDWSGHELTFLGLLKLRDPNLALPLLDQVYSNEMELSFKSVDFGPIEWWLDWLLEIAKSQDAHFILLERISVFLANHMPEEIYRKFITEFNRPFSRYRKVLSEILLPKKSNISTNDFNEEAISFLIEDLSVESGHHSWNPHLLGDIATEDFVTEQLVPLLSKTENQFQTNLREVLRTAGRRHGKRYVLN